MESLPPTKPRGLYFEDFEIGHRYLTPRRTVTHADISNFCGISGDFNAPHADWEFCKSQSYGEPIAHGPLVLAIATGLQCQSGMNDGTVIAMLSIDHWKIHLPVKHGDTLHVAIVPTAKRITADGRRGVVSFEREIINQHQQVVHTLSSNALYLCRESRSPAD
jgi:acyl dehydratase